MKLTRNSISILTLPTWRKTPEEMVMYYCTCDLFSAVGGKAGKVTEMVHIETLASDDQSVDSIIRDPPIPLHVDCPRDLHLITQFCWVWVPS